MAIGGPIESVTLAGREFAIAADADSNRDLGGFTATVESNGNGTARKIMARKPWRVDGIAVEIDDTRQDQEYIQGLADAPDYFPIAVTYVSGIVYQGLGTAVEDLQTSSASTTAPVILSGPQKLTQQ